MRFTEEHPLEFKFHWLSDEGQPTSVFSKKASFNGDVLKLEDVELPVVAIVQSVVRDNRMVLAFLTTDPENPTAHLLFQPANKKITDQLKEGIDIARSGVWAKHHREALEKKGLGHTYRDEVCPHCDATLILTNMPESPQLYCHFCDSLTTLEGEEAQAKEEKALRICEECGMYSKPRKFTIFYFYFLLVVYGWWSKATWRCPACMRGEAWKMLFGNLIFILGVPVAVVQLFRSYGGTDMGGKFKGLDTGNIRARKGDVPKALEQYRAILDRVPFSAGVKYNLALALLTQGDKERAADTFELALEDCINYAPAYNHLKALYTELGETQRLKELEAQWETDTGSDEDDVEDADALIEE